MRNLWKAALAIALGLSTIAGAVAAYDELRPYPTRSEHARVVEQIEQVAGRSCKNELELLFGERRAIERELVRAEQIGNMPWVGTLRQQLRDVEEKIEQVKVACGWR